MRAQGRFQAACSRRGSVCVLRKAVAAAQPEARGPRKPRWHRTGPRSNRRPWCSDQASYEGHRRTGTGATWEAPGVDGVHDLSNKIIFSRERKEVGRGRDKERHSMSVERQDTGDAGGDAGAPGCGPSSRCGLSPPLSLVGHGCGGQRPLPGG